MASLKRKDVLKNLARKGFRQNDTGKHTTLIYYNKQGLKTDIFTQVSRGTKYKSLGDQLVSTMANQCRLSVKDFRSLVDCTLSIDDFDSLVSTTE